MKKQKVIHKINDPISLELNDGSVINLKEYYDHRLGIKDLSGLKKNHLFFEKKINDSFIYAFVVDGGLGDCMMIIEVLYAFQAYLKTTEYNYHFILIMQESRLLFFKKIILQTFDNVDLISNLEIDKIKIIEKRVKYKVLEFPTISKETRVEHLSLGSFREHVWMIWGLPENYAQYSYPLAKTNFNTKSNSIICYSNGFGRANSHKRWSDEYWIELVRDNPHFNFTFSDPHLELEEKLKTLKNSKIIKSTKNSDFFEMKDIMTDAYCVISIDTGPAHIAGFLGIKTLVLWGPTNPIFYKHPNNINIRVSGCPPCFYSVRTDICVTKECMRAIKPKDISNVINN